MKRTRNAFTLIEMLIVIAIISILAAMAISSFSNAAQDSREVLVRQQLATVQEAVNNWASRQIGKVATNGGNPTTIEQVRVSYNAPTTATARLLLFQGYLDEATRAAITVNNTSGRLTTDAMLQTGYYLTLPTWSTGSYPKVQINP
jgi:prepilin-type N-terminal cleavage/methylation domain-containing protein